ncbi:MAG: uracil-DNA glycosylase [Alphaproteobacteria bacterium]|nr:uracil-DNA glycosylase [Alphaproteobacteria bacterium]
MSFAEPSRDCPFCPRLVGLRNELRAKFPTWSNAPVPSFGPIDAKLLIVGLAPGLKGANRTGRPFTGDYAGDLLYATLKKFGLAKGEFVADREDRAWVPDTLALTGVRIANAVRCLPPENKPTPKEAATCRPFLVAELADMKNLRAIVALGRGAHDAALAALGRKISSAKFAHGAQHDLGGGRVLADSYHCSRYNTNTGRLTPEMFEAVFAALLPKLG